MLPPCPGPVRCVTSATAAWRAGAGRVAVRTAAVAGGIVLILAILLDAFETIVLPRRVSRRIRLTRLFYSSTWMAWSALPRRRRRPIGPREDYLSFYGPLSLILLLIIWAAALVVGYALVQ